jgi:hypothetical protein
MALVLNYEKYRRRILHDEQLSHSCWLLLSVLLVLASGAGTVVVISNGSASGLVGVCGVLTLIFIVASGMIFAELLAVKAERPADRQSVSLLIYLVDQLGNRQVFVDEIGHLLRTQGDLYQYQVYALLLATKQLGLSKEQLKQLKKIDWSVNDVSGD